MAGQASCVYAGAKVQQLSHSQISEPPKHIISETTFRQCHQLEEGGFHTVRKLLHHFPRTYADLQTAPTEINDGDYLIFVGKVSSSRAIKISSSLSFLEIVVNVELVNDLEMCKKNINLHLKFFRGVRFTYQPFLRSIQSKYELGAHVYITGKVKKMLHEDHYEIREYNIGVLEEEDLNGQVENLLYPIYPSKAGMKPSFLKDIITRALKVLSKDIDPIPNNILQELNLPNLYDAYMGIHSPKRLSEANLARRRLNFDEFFYVQDMPLIHRERVLRMVWDFVQTYLLFRFL
ncbi:hypothetical protein HPP92_000300 [Vanilla planifolia]|uniref:Uncharacterized protein n=1 Tax=Vanilla planifolia TaxID=51239 RepID=A0A835VKE8_VANPL|nr:hypothetical protein HPP92_000300 [Vanilla planifolia]